MKNKLLFLTIIMLSITVSFSAQEPQIPVTWLSGMPGGYPVTDFHVFDSGVIYALNGKNLQISFDNGISWIKKDVKAHLMNLFNQEKGYFLKKPDHDNSDFQTHVYNTTDSGDSLTICGGRWDFEYFNDWILLENEIIIITTDNSITRASGIWEDVTRDDLQMDTFFKDLSLKPDGDIYLLARYKNSNRYIYLLSENRGVSWLPPNSGDIIIPALDKVKWVTNQTGIAANDTSVYKTTEGGTQWFEIHEELQIRYNSEFRDIVYCDESVYVIGLAGGLLVYKDNEWTYNAAPGKVPWVASEINKYVVKDGIIYAGGEVFLTTSDYGKTWRRLYDYNYLTQPNVIIEAVDENTWYKGFTYQTNKVSLTTDAGNTWINEAVIPEGKGISMLAFADKDTGLVVIGDGKIYRTVNGGKDGYTLAADFGEIRDIEMFDGNHGTAVNRFDIYITDDGGETWTNKNIPNGWLHSVSYSDRNTIFVVGEGSRIFRSRDRGKNWERMPFEEYGRHIYDVEFVSPAKGYIFIYGGIAYKTTDGGESWIRAYEIPYSGRFKEAEFNENIGLILDGYGGVYISFDSEKKQWEYKKITLPTSIGTNPYPNLRAMSLYNNIALISGNMGTVKITNDTITDIKNNDTDRVINNYFLSQNYPNPFNPSTNIKFSIKEAGQYRLSVYNMLGEEVKILVNKQLPAGEYTETFKADGLSSGVYIYRLSGEKINLANKMILMK